METVWVSALQLQIVLLFLSCLCYNLAANTQECLPEVKNCSISRAHGCENSTDNTRGVCNTTSASRTPVQSSSEPEPTLEQGDAAENFKSGANKQPSASFPGTPEREVVKQGGVSNSSHMAPPAPQEHAPDIPSHASPPPFGGPLRGNPGFGVVGSSTQVASGGYAPLSGAMLTGTKAISGGLESLKKMAMAGMGAAALGAIASKFMGSRGKGNGGMETHTHGIQLPDKPQLPMGQNPHQAAPVAAQPSTQQETSADSSRPVPSPPPPVTPADSVFPELPKKVSLRRPSHPLPPPPTAGVKSSAAAQRRPSAYPLMKPLKEGPTTSIRNPGRPSRLRFQRG